MISRDDFLMITSYEDIVVELQEDNDNWYPFFANGSILPKIQYCPLEHIHEFFGLMKGTRPYILVSANSDYGIEEQAIAHANFDLAKLMARMDVSRIRESRTDLYGEVVVGPACESDKCELSHKYSIKMDTWTRSTFDDVPDNVVKWYCTNVNINHPKISLLPFSLNWQGKGVDDLENQMIMNENNPDFRNTFKGSKYIYANFQNYCQRRLDLKRFLLSNDLPNVTFRPVADLPIEKFLYEMSLHKFILSPRGNGHDCFRTVEAAYLGAIPVLENSIFADEMKALFPATLVVENFEQFCLKGSDELDDIYNDLSWYKDLTKLTRSFWKNEFQEAIANL